jgi:IS30 family transposase
VAGALLQLQTARGLLGTPAFLQITAGIPSARKRPWERGTVENTNKLIRQFVPKQSTIEEISNEQIKMVEMVLNHRPRKTLGFRTPQEVYSQELR